MPSPGSGEALLGRRSGTVNTGGSELLTRPNVSHPLPRPRFDHLERMTSPLGLWEHALYSSPRPEHGYCTDDNARALIVVSRQPDPSPDLVELAWVYLRFIADAQLPDGGFRNRRSSDGSWLDQIGSDDSQGRALWALGSVAHHGSESRIRDVGMDMFNEQQQFLSPSLRSNAFAALGAAEVLAASPDHRHARRLLQHCVGHLDVPDDALRPWPEERLTYDNARIPEALLAAGALLSDQALVDAGLRLLEWLVARETYDGHFSFTPVGGWAPGEPQPGFDQQPVEAAAMADACSRAWSMTRNNQWRDVLGRTARWFVGANDAGLALYDPWTGACGDGLSADHINQNRGAESTLAALSVLQHAEALGLVWGGSPSDTGSYASR